MIGRIFNLFFHSIIPTENSLPSINSSIKIILSSLNAIFTAFSRSFSSFTLLTPILLPPELGFTKQGNLILSYINFKSLLFLSLISGRNPDLLIGQHVKVAQQVKEYYPEAVRLVKKCIPDVMKSLTNVTWTEVNEEDTIKYKLSSNLTNVNGIKYRFYVRLFSHEHHLKYS